MTAQSVLETAQVPQELRVLFRELEGRWDEERHSGGAASVAPALGARKRTVYDRQTVDSDRFSKRSVI
jgi:hypothetical protein